MDRSPRSPHRKAATLALRTQQIIAYESGVADVIDPMAGSYYVENLTDEMEKEPLNTLNALKLLVV